MDPIKLSLDPNAYAQNLLAKKSERSVIALPTILRRSKQKRA